MQLPSGKQACYRIFNSRASATCSRRAVTDIFRSLRYHVPRASCAEGGGREGSIVVDEWFIKYINVGMMRPHPVDAHQKIIAPRGPFCVPTRRTRSAWILFTSGAHTNDLAPLKEPTLSSGSPFPSGNQKLRTHSGVQRTLCVLAENYSDLFYCCVRSLHGFTSKRALSDVLFYSAFSWG